MYASHSLTRLPVKSLIPAMMSDSNPVPRIVSPATMPRYRTIRYPSSPGVVTAGICNGPGTAMPWEPCGRALNLPGETRLGDAHALNRMMAGNEVPRDAKVPALLPDRPALLRRVDRDRRVRDVPTLLDLDFLHVVVAEHVGDELLGIVRIFDHVDVLVHQPLELRGVLALLPDRPTDVAFLHDEDEAVSRIDAVHDRRPGHVLEQSDIAHRLLVEGDLGHDDPRGSGCSTPRGSRSRRPRPGRGPHMRSRAPCSSR